MRKKTLIYIDICMYVCIYVDSYEVFVVSTKNWFYWIRRLLENKSGWFCRLCELENMYQIKKLINWKI